MSPTRPRQTTQRVIQGDCLEVLADMESDRESQVELGQKRLENL